jgi:hypothetical protein
MMTDELFITEMNRMRTRLSALLLAQTLAGQFPAFLPDKCVTTYHRGNWSATYRVHPRGFAYVDLHSCDTSAYWGDDQE